jgi:hypothetical protein
MFERLTDEEINIMVENIPEDDTDGLDEYGLLRVGIEQGCRAQGKATLKDVIEWGESDCLHDYRLLKRKCSKCWQELKDQTERIK